VKIVIVEATLGADGTRVVFRARDSVGAGRWMARTPPVIGEDYDAEFTIDRALEEVVQTVTTGSRRFELLGEENRIHAEVEQLDEDGVAFLRIAPDCVFMIEASGSVVVGASLSLSLPWQELQVYVQGG
jgi:hypothetical protein